MGPIAPIIVEDKIAEFEEAREAFPKEKAEPLIQAISEEIEDSAERDPFVKAMTEFLHRRHSNGQPQAAVSTSLPGVFFSAVETELARSMGHCPIIVEDKLAEFGESRTRFRRIKQKPLCTQSARRSRMARRGLPSPRRWRSSFFGGGGRSQAGGGLHDRREEEWTRPVTEAPCGHLRSILLAFLIIEVSSLSV